MKRFFKKILYSRSLEKVLLYGRCWAKGKKGTKISSSGRSGSIKGNDPWISKQFHKRTWTNCLQWHKKDNKIISGSRVAFPDWKLINSDGLKTICVWLVPAMKISSFKGGMDIDRTTGAVPMPNIERKREKSQMKKMVDLQSQSQVPDRERCRSCRSIRHTQKRRRKSREWDWFTEWQKGRGEGSLFKILLLVLVEEEERKRRKKRREKNRGKESSRRGTVTCPL